MSAAEQLSLDAMPPAGDCPMCDGTGRRVNRETGETLACRNCDGTGTARVPY